MGDPDRVMPLLDPTHLIHHPRLDRLQMGDHLQANRAPHGFIAPRAAANQLLQTLRIQPQAFGHRLNRFVMSRHQQTSHIAAGCHTPFASSQTGHQRSHKFVKPVYTFFPKFGVPFHTAKTSNPAERCQELLNKVILGQSVGRFGTVLYGYVLMDNHFHLIVEPQEDNLSRAMQWLNVSYSQWFNRRHQRSGHLFQGRFKSVVVDWQAWGLELSRYVHLNPVRTGQEDLDKRARQRNRAGVGRAVSLDTEKCQRQDQSVAGLPVEFLSSLHRTRACSGVAVLRPGAWIDGGKEVRKATSLSAFGRSSVA